MIIPRLLRWLNPQRLLTLARRLGANTDYLVFPGQRLTRAQVFEQVDRLAGGLQALGIQKGDRVVALLPSCPESVYSLFVPWMLGSVEVPLNPLLREHELRYILADCGAKAVITTQSWLGQDYPALMARLLPDLPDLRAVIVRDAEGSDGDMFFSLDEVLARGDPLRQVPLSAEEMVRITYTSGTTGMPKGVVRSWDRVFSLVRPEIAPRLNPRLLRSLLQPFPMCYYSGLLGAIATLLSGGKLVMMDRFRPRLAWEFIEQERVTQVGGSPTMFRLMLRMRGQEQYDVSSVRRITYGSEPMPPELARALHDRFQAPIEQFYAMNETGNITWTALDDPPEVAATTVGKPVPGVELRIVDDDRRPLPDGERGEVAVKTSQMMLGYYLSPELTTQVLDDEGWFYTGDVGYVGDDGNLRLVDRKKDLIIRGGQNVYPAEVEGYLELHPAVQRAGVVGVPSEIGGESVWAYVQLVPGAEASATELRSFCRGRIAGFKVPSQVRFVERIPLSVTDKVQRYKLRELAAEELAEKGD
ncbi:MAG: AMP-binding protein [Anaerolineae bacterium]|jgi:fatty-acyl-CoA synthase/long-chain acyl-CoA synthetase